MDVPLALNYIGIQQDSNNITESPQRSSDRLTLKGFLRYTPL